MRDTFVLEGTGIEMTISEIRTLAGEMQKEINRVIIGQEKTVKFTTAALFAGGHVLIEEVPGSGKTMLAKTMCRTLGGTFSRIQMTPDLLPADITGINYYNMKTSEFHFIKGPVFANILIADEINRATPKTQSGLLECMEEKQVTVDGTTYPLEDIFMVIATQNPVDHQGVFPLPEAQIDRFLVKLDMKYPEHEEIVNVIRTHLGGGEKVLEQVRKITDVETISEARDLIRELPVHGDLLDYAVQIAEETRKHPGVLLGVSQRGILQLVRMAQALAAFEGRAYVLPDDIKEAAVPVLAHRLIARNSERINKNRPKEIIEEILEKVPVPTE